MVLVGKNYCRAIVNVTIKNIPAKLNSSKCYVIDVVTNQRSVIISKGFTKQFLSLFFLYGSKAYPSNCFDSVTADQLLATKTKI